MGYNKAALDSEVYHVNTLKLHGEVRKAEIVDIGFDKKDEAGKVIEHIAQNVIELKIDDDDLDRIVLIDRDVAHIELYERGQIGTFTMRLDITKSFGSKYETKLQIIDFKLDKKKE